ncbi:TniB family NTP-binding protein [Luteimonas fraxinea]|uniref:TniB family NTP-binding protein n=1 Tax=Luteimonas fraxinea TaxID=2901869 RepID=A0ABS8UAI2_9GAMM|nr:TniB family NTP-binding protein [Luteimonas fraxinea]MCD9096501.1 TniB family NTP-binding protein [Luteimonas fraxinea]MCD9125843.1 TniB family NTP-binding protein [Luteimonas fraxinea]UHH10057.1 TniB family NTP-binding protein [Luteimonas fraxinea]
MSDFNHLDPSVRGLLDLSSEERAGRMLVERFITHERLVPIFQHVEFLIHMPTQTRANGLVVSGKPGSGKTMLSRAIQRRYPATPAENGEAASRPVLTINMTNAREAKTLYNRILGGLGVPDPGRYSGSDRERMVLKLCSAANVRLLVVDEIQDILTTTARQQRIALDTIKFLMNELSLPILTLGTSSAPAAMQVDEHLNARFKYRELPLWTRDEFLTNFLDTLEKALPLRKRSYLSSPTLSTDLIRLSGGVLQTIVQLVTHAAAHSVESGEDQITSKLLERAAVEAPLAAAKQAAVQARLGRVA